MPSEEDQKKGFPGIEDEARNSAREHFEEKFKEIFGDGQVVSRQHEEKLADAERAIAAHGGRGSAKSGLLDKVRPDLPDLDSYKKDPRYKPRYIPSTGWNSATAWKLSKYMSPDRLQVEWLWNSRDGVTPFIIRGKDNSELRHADFQEDLYAPNFVPAIGTRIFTDHPTFDPSVHQFNLFVQVVDVMTHNKFRDQAAWTPWVLGKVVIPNRFA